MQKWGFILLAIWLIAVGLISLLGIQLPGGDLLLNLLAIAAGVLLLIGVRKIRLRSGLGVLLLGIWLILTGLLPLVKLSFPGLDVVMAVLAVAAGILLLLKR